jgi:hypothetical protein
MRILAFSDVYKWTGYERLVDQYKPHVVALAGDLTSNGSAYFWNAALEAVPRYKKQIEALERQRTQCLLRDNRAGLESIIPGKVGQARQLHPGPETRIASARLREVHDLCRKDPAYQAARKKIHVDRFYRFLKYAGKRAFVVVIKGDHDDDFPGDYDLDRINSIPGCREISGQTLEAKGAFFLGVSYQETAYRRIARALLARFPQRGGIAISHARQRNVRLLAELRPRLIIRGHYGCGKFLLEGIPAVFTDGGPAIVNLSDAALPHIRLLSDKKGRETIALTPETLASIEDLWLKDYPWLAPYPEPGKCSPGLARTEPPGRILRA